MLNWLFKLSAPWKALLFYGIPLIQFLVDRAGGPGTRVAGFVFGFFPSVFLYLTWLLAIQVNLGQNVSRFFLKHYSFHFVRYELIGFFMPFQLWWIHVLINNSADWIPLMLPVVGMVSLVFFLLLLHSFLSLARIINLLNKQTDKPSFAQYGLVFFYFLLGPFTIWLLQSQVIMASKNRWSDFTRHN
ncbi:MAG TPA: hypothetical protein PLX35_12610 [Cyclobacteriaceae bacterium]|nr:hypothetical protein [Cyclobacteriaceae bacterium]